MPPEPAPRLPFPDRAADSYRADSVAEEHAFLRAYPPAGTWELVSQTLQVRHEAPRDQLTVRAPEYGEVTVPFDIASFFGAATGGEPANLDTLLETALEFARANPPHHPGSLPRFPVPAAGYPGRVEVPMALVAVDDRGRPGLYAPPRVVVTTFPAGEPVGVGELAGFDPAQWPPRRLGDWPPAAMHQIDQTRLQAMVIRFTAVWSRLLGAWLTSEDYPQRGDEAREALALLAQLDVPGMLGVYERMNPRFWRWLTGST